MPCLLVEDRNQPTKRLDGSCRTVFKWIINCNRLEGDDWSDGAVHRFDDLRDSSFLLFNRSLRVAGRICDLSNRL